MLTSLFVLSDICRSKITYTWERPFYKYGFSGSTGGLGDGLFSQFSSVKKYLKFNAFVESMGLRYIREHTMHCCLGVLLLVSHTKSLFLSWSKCTYSINSRPGIVHWVKHIIFSRRHFSFEVVKLFKSADLVKRWSRPVVDCISNGYTTARNRCPDYIHGRSEHGKYVKKELLGQESDYCHTTVVVDTVLLWVSYGYTIGSKLRRISRVRWSW